MVEIPDDVAKRMAAFFRQDDEGPDAMGFKRWADLLDPKPPTLREQVAKAWCAEWYGEPICPLCTYETAALLAVVADWLAAQPLAQSCGLPNGEGCFVREQRDHDVRLLRGES